MAAGTLPDRDAVRLAFELALESHVASLPADSDILAELSAAHARLKRQLETAACTSPDAVEEVEHRALVAAQLDAAISILKARYTKD
jgi:hypothetical protein